MSLENCPQTVHQYLASKHSNVNESTLNRQQLSEQLSEIYLIFQNEQQTFPSEHDASSTTSPAHWSDGRQWNPKTSVQVSTNGRGDAVEKRKSESDFNFLKLRQTGDSGINGQTWWKWSE